jgi:D-aminopeptidase
VPKRFGGYTVGVIVQTNFGGVLEINGVPIAKELNNYPKSVRYDVDGSCMIVIMTDAPLDARNLERMAKRAMLGLAKTGGIASNGSGDYVIAVSTTEQNRIPYAANSLVRKSETLRNDVISPLFLATIEATEEAIINSLFAAETTVGQDGHRIEALPVEQVLKIIEVYQGHKK